MITINFHSFIKALVKNFTKIIIKKINPFFKKIINKIKNAIANNKKSYFEVLIKLIYSLILIIVLVNIVSFSYKAWLYPIRLHQYFDECSYISMGKYFRTISPIKIFTDYILQNKKIPKLYNEFNCRLIYWSIILSFPLKYTEDRIELHKFRAWFLTIGTIIFFLIGFKLGGITGGVVSAAFWIGTPIINYWGHFFMTENPSFVFLATGYLCLLYSDRFTISSFIGGIFLGIACFIRFTTISLIFAAPFIIIAVYFNPFKRKNFQILGELSKTLSGIIFATLPYLIFTWWMYKNPFVPFMAANSAVQNSFVNDPLYYARNLWNESGLLLQIGIVLSFISPFIISTVFVLKKILKNNFKVSKIIYRDESNNSSETNIFKIIKVKLYSIKYLNTFVQGLIYYGIIILSLIISSSIYIYIVTGIPHKLPRYMMGAIIPLIFISAIGYGVIELFIINIFRFIGNTILNNFNYKNNKFLLQNSILISTWLTGFAACIIIISLIPINIWNKTMNKPFNIRYEVQDEAVKELKKNNEFIAIQRLQPENLAWNNSINERLKEVSINPKKGIDEDNYSGDFFWSIIRYLNKTLKEDEVFYVDIFNYTPYLTAYIEVPCAIVDSYYNNSIETLIQKEEILYKGYVLIYNNPDEEIVTDNENTYVRSLNSYQIASTNKFKFIRRFGNLSLYYYTNGIPFPLKFGTKERIAKLYKNKIEDNNKKPLINQKDLFDKLLSPWKELFKK